VAVDRNEAALMAKWSRKAIVQVTDLLDVESRAAMVPEIIAKTGRIDIPYSNAEIYVDGELIDTDAPTVNRMLTRRT
jgi:ribitol 2-dehydrogenase